MRSLSATLLAAQKSAVRVPYLKTVISDRIAGVKRLAWTRYYTGAEPDSYHAATMAGDGSLIRARVTGGTLYYQRVTSPGAGSSYSSWTNLGAAANAGVALCSDGARVLLFYVDSGGLAVKVRESTDYGATLGAAVTVVTAGAAVGWLSADVKSNGDACLIYDASATVYAVRRISSVWGSSTAWGIGVASVAGHACYYIGDWNVVVCGVDTAGASYAWSAVFGDGFSVASGTWSTPQEISKASPGTSVTHRAPFLSRPDTFRLTYVEKYTGTVAYNRPQLSHSPAAQDYIQNLWREPIPFNLSTDYGLAIAFSSAAVWACTPAGVWYATLDVPTSDVTADVLTADTDDRPYSGHLRLELRNDHGAYNGLPAPLRAGAEIAVSPGYVTTAGTEYSDGPRYWITRLENRTGRGRSTVVVEAQDCWSLLENWRARRQYSWAAGEKTVYAILQWVFARAGLDFSADGASSTSTSFYPAFTIAPGESALTAVKRLLDMLPDVIRISGEFAYLHEPLASDSADYAYGTDHAIEEGRYGDEPPPANRAQVFGTGVFAEAYDWDAIAETNDQPVQVADKNITTQAQAEARGDTLLRRSALAAPAGRLTAALNCGLELYDVIEITDPAAALTAAKRRVTALSLLYSAPAARYEQTLTLSEA
jgi:hypothetical protein